MNNGKKFALRITALMLCLCTVSAVLSSCGFFADSYLENNTGIAVKTEKGPEKTSPVTTEEDIIPGTTKWDETTNTPETADLPETTKTPETTKAPETTKVSETTKTPETTLSPEQLDNIPDDVQTHVYLEYKNSGRCAELIGNVTVTVVLVNDDVSAWNDKALSELSSSLSSQEKDIEKLAASYGKNLDLTFSYMSSKISGDAAAGDYFNLWLDSAAVGLGFKNLNNMQKELDSKNNADSNPILFALNKTGRAYAHYSSGTNSAEYLVVFSSDYSAFNHELYHVYGARDFYYPDEVEELANTYLTESIMSNGKVTDPLTAFIIGWDNEIDTEAYEFLKKTSHLTNDYLEQANKQQSITGYVTDHKLDYGTYTGYLERGVPTGQGTLIGNDGYTAEGTFLGGSLNGKGKMTWSDGSYYEGDYVNGNRHGTGTYHYTNGNVYVGEWVNGERTGKGTFTYADGGKYVGDFKDGYLEGHGVYTGKDGYKYEGAWKNGKREGYGVATWANGTKYEGNWSNDKYNGKGKMTWDDGSYYDGDYKEGERHGNGSYYFANGTVYTGQWANGNRNGQGTYTSPNGFSYTGNWKDDQYNGYGEVKYVDGGTYKGNFLNGLRHGEGTYVYPAGHKYVGAWAEGQRSGKGYMTWSDGSSYDGEWKDSKRHGYGKYIHSNGQVFEGQWENDVYKG